MAEKQFTPQPLTTEQQAAIKTRGHFYDSRQNNKALQLGGTATPPTYYVHGYVATFKILGGPRKVTETHFDALTGAVTRTVEMTLHRTTEIYRPPGTYISAVNPDGDVSQISADKDFDAGG